MMKKHALSYAEQGWRVIPIFWTSDGMCGCGNPFCTAPGKHPLVKMGRKLENASCDPAVVREWWNTWPQANIAVALGPGTNLFVVDLDIGEDTDGHIELQAWAEANGVEIPSTLEAETGSGGRHLFYTWPGGIKNATGWLPCVDIKAEGGYVLVAPSSHVSGGSYRWMSTDPAATVAEPLLGHLRGARSRVRTGHGGDGAPAPAYDYREACRTGPPKGARDHFFNSRAFELRKMDWSYQDALEELKRHWSESEQPPGDEWPWEEVVRKLDRVWGEVEPDPLPDWDPTAAAGPQEGAPPPPPDTKDTDVGNAKRFANEHQNDVRYASQLDWLVWDGTKWRVDELGRHKELAKQTVATMFTYAARQSGDERERWLAWAKASESRQRIEAMVTLARTDPLLVSSVHDFDKDPMILAVENGTVDLRTGELREHRRADMITRRSHVTYDPSATSAIFDQYLHSVTQGDTDLQAYLQRAVGYTLTGLTVEEVFFMIYGPKASGKSTFVDGMQTVLGELSMTTQADTLVHMRGSQAPKDELASMLGARMVATVEIEEGQRFAEALVKQLTGGDKIAARQLYKTRFEFIPTFKLWIATNHAPRAYDDAIWRRIKRVPFPVEVPKAQQDMRLKAMMKDPSSEVARAFLAWAVRGCLLWQQAGLGTCLVVEEDTAEYREEQDKFSVFLEERIDVSDQSALTSSKDLYLAYTSWCQENGERPMTSTSFGIKLKERGFVKARSTRPISWNGLKVLPTQVNSYGI
jgi:putative DNA primase/helicase